MSAITIEIPTDHVDAVRDGVLAQRRDADRHDEIDSLLAQIPEGLGAGAGSPRVTGPRTILWNAIYDSLCRAAEQLADDCNDYWRGDIAPEAARASVAAVAARLELLIGLGPRPGS